MTSPRAIKLIDRHLDPKTARTVLDYGCDDQAFKPHFQALGYRYEGWDVDHDQEPQAADLVNLSYVLNVIATEAERGQVLARAWAFSREAMVITIPPGYRLAQESKWCRKTSDDLLAERRSFANLENENQMWLDARLDAEIIRLAPDVFLCLRDGSEAYQPSIANLVAARASQLLPRRKTLALMASVLGGALALSATPSMAQYVEQRVADVIASQLGLRRDQIKSDSSFVNDLGADSLDTVELIMALEDEFNIDIPDEDADEMETVFDAINYMKQNAQ